MRRVVLCAVAALLLPAGAGAQAIQVPTSWDKLSARAKESVKVNLDASLLGFAAQFISDDDEGEDAETRQLVGRLRGITVRSLEFAKPGEYSEADVEAVRAQLAGWKPLVEATDREDGEKVEVFVRTEKDQVVGLVVLAREPQELTFVHIDGPLDPADLSRLGGRLGIPRSVGAAKGKEAEKPQPEAAKK